MCCTTCKAVVQVNETGTCKSCQFGFTSRGADSYEFHQLNEIIEDKKREIEALEEKLEEKQKPKQDKK